MDIYIKQLAFVTYEIQHQINTNLIKEINHITLFSFVLLFIGGMLTSLSPCMTYSIPLIISYFPIETGNKNMHLFVLSGMITSIVGIGTLLISVKINTIGRLNNIQVVSSLLYFIIGLNILEILSINFPIDFISTTKFKYQSNLFAAYILGISIGLTISPCNTPILTGLILWLTHTKNILVGISLLGIYTLGYISPILLYIIYIPYFTKIQIPSILWESFLHLSGGTLITISIFSFCHLYWS